MSPQSPPPYCLKREWVPMSTHEHGPWIERLDIPGHRICSTCHASVDPEDCFHEWQTVDPWGIIFGVTPCRRCGTIARGEDF